jgi:hypothetical protein
MMEGVNPTKIYCKNVCKYHNVPPSTTIKNVLKNELMFKKTNQPEFHGSDSALAGS